MGASQKVAIITGASQGIGEALVRAYRDRDFRVVANSRSIRSSSDPEILAVAGDITDSATAERIVSQAIERFARPVDPDPSPARASLGGISIDLRFSF
ncbi:NAD(P)-dependent dehydrogenase (short-subunit alcohol dehydrogenase family) [Bradyrhizobium sp. USDA 4452]